jgi:hypothetical protein
MFIQFQTTKGKKTGRQLAKLLRTSTKILFHQPIAINERA